MRAAGMSTDMKLKPGHPVASETRRASAGDVLMEAATVPGKTIPAITRDPEIHSGAPVFTRTRIAAKVLFDYLEDGQTVDDLVSHYPSVSREQAIAALEEVEDPLGVTAQPGADRQRRGHSNRPDMNMPATRLREPARLRAGCAAHRRSA